MPATARPARRSGTGRSTGHVCSRSATALSALPVPKRRKKIDPTTCERDYRPEEVEFMRALDAYKRASGRMFPTCSEILEVVHRLGYRRVGTV
jgi:hypothetical protein